MKRVNALAVMFVILAMATVAFGYTELWTPPYHDYTPMGGTAITNSPTNMIGVTPGYGFIQDTLHVPVHTACCTLSVTNGGGIYDPVIWCLNGTIGMKIGIPQAVNSTTIIPFGPVADSTSTQLPGVWKKFIIYITATADSTAAHGYVVQGRSAPSTMLTHNIIF